MKKILLTGGAGYIGSVLAKMLLQHGYHVTLVDCFFYQHKPIEEIKNHPNLTVVEADIQNSEKMASLMETGMDIIHLAALSNDPSCDLDPKLSIAINHYATVRLAEEAKKKGVNRFIFASSCSVYGFGSNEKLKESSLCNPVSAYAELKLKSENDIIELASNNFCPVSIRQATIYGYSPRMRFDLAINQMVMHGITRGRIFVMGGGSQWRPFLHVKDAARMFITCLNAERSKVYQQTFNAGSDKHNFQIADLAKFVAEEIGNVELIIAPDDNDKRSYSVDFSKAEVMLGFAVQENMKAAIKEMADYVRCNEKIDFDSSDYYNMRRLEELTKLGKEAKILGLP